VNSTAKASNVRNTRIPEIRDSTRIERSSSRLKGNIRSIAGRSAIADESAFLPALSSSCFYLEKFLFSSSDRARENSGSSRIAAARKRRIIWEFVRCNRASLLRAGGRGNDSRHRFSRFFSHVSIFLLRARLLSRAYARTRTHTSHTRARTRRAQSRRLYYRSNTLFHRRARRRRPDSRTAILDPRQLKDASAFPSSHPFGVSCKEFKLETIPPRQRNVYSSHFALGGSLIREKM